MSSPQTQPSTPQRSSNVKPDVEGTADKSPANNEDHISDEPHEKNLRKNSSISLCGFHIQKGLIDFSIFDDQQLDYPEKKEFIDAIHDRHLSNLIEDSPSYYDSTNWQKIEENEINFEVQPYSHQLTPNQKKISREESGLLDQLEIMGNPNTIEMEIPEIQESNIDVQLPTDEQEPDQNTLLRKEKVQRYLSKRQRIRNNTSKKKCLNKSKIAKQRKRLPNGQFAKKNTTDSKKPKGKRK